MNLNIQDWKNFKFGALISDIYKAKAINREGLLEAININDSIRYITRTGNNNGCEMIVIKSEVDNSFIEKGNAISIGDTTATCFYQPEDFITGDHMVVVRAEWLNELLAMYIVTILKNEQYKYSYGRAFLMERIKETNIKLPVCYISKGIPYIDDTHRYSDDGYVPDWSMMESYIRSLHCKPLTTKNKKEKLPDLELSSWKPFLLSDIFIIKYGVNMELNACEEVNEKNCHNVNFVSRTSENNGVSARVKIIENVIPQKAGLISIAGGGSVLSTFLQTEPFYSGRDLYTLDCKENISKEAKIFLITIIEKNKYKYSYGRQANKTMPYIEILLPIKHNSDGTLFVEKTKKYSKEGYVPDWEFMEKYIKALPYGDRL